MMAMSAKTLGFIGVGDMGGPMAGRLMDAGYSLVIHDVREDATAPLAARGATVLESPKAVADSVETIIVSLPTPDVVRAVALSDNGIIHGSAVRRYVDLSTTGAVMAVEVSTALSGKGVECLDSPVSGGVRGAEAGTLALMVSGDKAFYEDMLPVFAAIGKNPFYLGAGAGLGQTMKLTNNYLSATANIATAEAMVMGVKAGLDPKIMVEVFNASSGRNDSTMNKVPNSILNRRFDKSMKQRLLYKDVRLCMAEAEALDMPMWLGNSVKQVLAFAVSQGTGDEPSVALIKYLEDWTGVTVGEEEKY
ncbi:MAG: 3-hydroxyisobutyrate dehydrogenase-like beta-hydroxyacid dehydrogenase [Alphaproteobacteria bacterium]|jgi:3-hydroxyisobutyrate dehydrogenase-like beta-hydroxyacid dehydrogenase